MTIVLGDYDNITIEYKGTKFILDAIPPTAYRLNEVQPFISLVPLNNSNGRVLVTSEEDNFGDLVYKIKMV